MASRAARAFAEENDAIPSDVRIVRDFVNTVEIQVGDERLRAPVDLGQWLTTQGLLDDDAPVGLDHLALATTLREGLRGVLQRHAGHEPDATSMRRFDDALGALPVRARFDGDGGFGLVPVSADPVEAALASLLAAVRSAVDHGTWPRLKVCSRNSCRWAYFDRSRNRSSRWCTTAGCGNIMKMRRAHTSAKEPG